MYPMKSTLRITFAATTLALTTAAYAQINDSIRGAPSEANHFVETPQGWKNPTTPMGRARHSRQARHDAGVGCPARALRETATAPTRRRAT